MVDNIMGWFVDRKNKITRASENLKEKYFDKPEVKNLSLIELLHELKSLIQIIQKDSSHHTDLIDTVDALIESYDSPLLITVLGEFSSGKSTFINSVLGESILPMKQRETTATITKIRSGKERKLIVNYRNGQIDEYEITNNKDKNISTYIVENFKESDNILDKVSYVALELENDILQSVDIADTPGFNSEFNRHTEITTEFVKYSDLVIWLFNAKQLGKASEINNLEKHCKLFKPIGVINQIDRLNLKEGQTVEDSLSNSLKKFDGLFEKIFYTSAIKGLDAKSEEYADSGLEKFLLYLNQTIIPEANERKKASITSKFIQIGSELNTNLNELITIETDLNDQIENLERLFNKYESWTAKWDTIISNLDRDIEDVRLVLKNYNDYFLLAEPSKSIITQVEKYLENWEFIEDKYGKLNNEINEIEDERIKLDRLLDKFNRRYNSYENKGFGLKQLGDDLMDGMFVSDEKKQINRLGRHYTKQQNEFNEWVDDYNLRLDKHDNFAEQFDESALYFINNVLLVECERQLDQLNKLKEKVEEKSNDYKILVEKRDLNEEKLRVYNEQISSIYTELGRTIGVSEDKATKSDNDFSELISSLSDHMKHDEAIDWTRIYKRSAMDRKILNASIDTSNLNNDKLHKVETVDYKVKKV